MHVSGLLHCTDSRSRIVLLSKVDRYQSMLLKLSKLRQKHTMLKGLTLVAFVWSQFAFAAHQLEHDTVDHEEHCAVCVKFDRDDDTLVGNAPTLLVPLVDKAVAIDATVSVSIPSTSLFRARASP